MSNDKGVLEENVNRILELYQQNSKRFERIFVILIGVALFFFFAAVLPYFSIQFEKFSIVEKQRELLRNINETLIDINKTNQNLSQINYIKNVQIPRTNDLQSSAEKNLTMLEKNSKNYPQEVLVRLKQQYNDTREYFIKLKQILESRLANLTKNESTLKENLVDLKSSLVKQKTQEKVINDIKRAFDARWNNLETPFGKLPADLTNLIAIFPLALVSVFLACTFLLDTTIRLRRTLHYLYKKKDPSGGIIADWQISIVAPIIVDPIDYEQNKFVQFSLLATPFVIFAATLVMILYIWHIADSASFPAANEFNIRVYDGIYLLCIGIFGYSYWLIVKLYTRYLDNLPKNKSFLNIQVQNKVVNLVKCRKLSQEQGDLLLKNLLKAKDYIENKQTDLAKQCIEEFSSELKYNLTRS